MKADAFETFYRDVPLEQRERLRAFRDAHPNRQIVAAGYHWQYTFCGEGEDVLLVLPGGTRVSGLQSLSELEAGWRVLSPTYPCANSITELVDGIAGILDYEEIYQAHVLGASLGGMVAQCFVRRYPDRVDRLVLANTFAPNRNLARRWKAILGVLSVLPRGIVRDLSRRRLDSLLARPDADPRLLHAYRDELLALHLPKEWFQCQYRLLIDFAENYAFAPGDLSDWGGHMLILESDADELVSSPARAALRSLYPEARVETLGGGHLTAATGQQYVSAVKAFLQEP